MITLQPPHPVRKESFNYWLDGGAALEHAGATTERIEKLNFYSSSFFESCLRRPMRCFIQESASGFMDAP